MSNMEYDFKYDYSLIDISQKIDPDQWILFSRHGIRYWFEYGSVMDTYVCIVNLINNL